MTEEEKKMLIDFMALKLMEVHMKALIEGFKMGRQFVLAEMGVKEQ